MGARLFSWELGAGVPADCESEVKACPSLSHVGIVVALPFAASTHGKDGPGTLATVESEACWRWLCSPGLGSELPCLASYVVL